MTRVAPAPDDRPQLVRRPGVKGERSESRSDAAGALEAGAAHQTIQDREPGLSEEIRALMTACEVASWLRVSPSTLCRWRMAGIGPPVIWLSENAPRYERVAVEAWLEERSA